MVYQFRVGKGDSIIMTDPLTNEDENDFDEDVDLEEDDNLEVENDVVILDPADVVE
jgi:hypothetical protein